MSLTEILVTELIELGQLIANASNPRDAVRRAKRAILADASDLATDAALDAALKARK